MTVDAALGANRVGAGAGSLRRSRVTIPLLLVALVGVMLAGVAVGSVSIPVTDVISVVADRLGFGSADVVGSTSVIVWTIRVPRVLLAAVVGAGLGVCGVVMQALVRNPIADPYLLGVSSGASVGAIAVIALGFGSGVWALTGMAFVGALAAVALVVTISGIRQGLAPVRTILAGVAVASLCSALGSFLLFLSPRAESARQVLFWLLGSLSGASWIKVAVPAVVVLGGIGWIVVRASWLDALAMGDETAASLGVDARRARVELIVLASLMTASMVAVSGAIGFVGLLLPHVARMLVGFGHRALVLHAALVGAAFLVLVDLAARTVASPQEIPVGILTAGIGAPAFCWFLWRLEHRRAS
ncbi:MAG: iron ABC transporter permease [Ilumatobacteraceae bacterium]